MSLMADCIIRTINESEQLQKGFCRKVLESIFDESNLKTSLVVLLVRIGLRLTAVRTCD